MARRGSLGASGASSGSDGLLYVGREAPSPHHCGRYLTGIYGPTTFVTDFVDLCYSTEPVPIFIDLSHPPRVATSQWYSPAEMLAHEMPEGMSVLAPQHQGEGRLTLSAGLTEARPWLTKPC